MRRFFLVVFALCAAAYQNRAWAQFIPPGKIVHVAAGTCTGNAAADIKALDAASSRAGTGNTVQVATNHCSVTGIWKPPVAVYWYVAPTDNWTLTGPGTVVLSDNSTIDGVTTCNIKFDLRARTNITIGNGEIGASKCGSDQIDITNSRGVVIINNDFVNVGAGAPPGGGGIYGWSATRFKIDGNHFDGCNECLNFANGGGADSTIARNILRNTARAYLELGYDESGPATTNLLVSDNWAARSPSLTCGDACLAFSVVPDAPGSRDTMISGNYAQGNYPKTKGICIELSNPGIVRNNICDGWYIGASFYLGALNGGATISNNDFSNTDKLILPRNIAHIGTTTDLRQVPPLPRRIAWGGHRSATQPNSPRTEN